MRQRTFVLCLCAVFGAYSYASASSSSKNRRERPEAQNELTRCMANVDTLPKKRMCAALEASRMEEAMQAAYDELLTMTSNDPEAAGRVKAVQNAWVAAQPQYEPLPQIEVSLRRAKLAERQAAALRQLLEQYAAGRGGAAVAESAH